MLFFQKSVDYFLSYDHFFKFFKGQLRDFGLFSKFFFGHFLRSQIYVFIRLDHKGRSTG